MVNFSSDIRLSFSDAQTLIDSVFNSLDVLLSQRDIALRSRNYSLCNELDKQWYELHHVLDILLAFQKSLI